MHIHIQGPGIHLQVQHRKGETALGNLGLISMVDSLADHTVIDAAAVNQQRLPGPGTF